MNALIQFFYEEVDFKFDSEDNIILWILKSLEAEGQEAGTINIIFCNDDYLLDLNLRFLYRDALTDVIAFDYGDDEEGVSGDIFISIDRVRENALHLGFNPENELMRVIIHGILHLCGYQDKSFEDKSLMTAKEDKYLSLLAQ